MKIDCVIREAQEKDVPELCALHRRILKLEGVSQLISDKQLRSWYAVDTLPGHLIAVLDDKIVSHIEIKERDFLYDNLPLSCGELAAVHTHPDYRGRNLGLNLLNQGFGFMKKHGMPFSKVLSGVRHFYQSACYELFPLVAYPVVLAHSSEKMRQSGVKDSAYSIVPYSARRDGGQIYAVYQVHNVLVPAAGNRSRAYWRRLRSDEENGVTCLVVRKGTETIGYLEARPLNYYADDLLEINVLVDGTAEEALFGLVRTFLEHRREQKYARAVIRVNDGKERLPQKVEEILSSAPLFESALMFRLIDLRKMVESLLPIWNVRFKNSAVCFRGGLEIECLGSSVILDIQNHGLSLRRAKSDLRNVYLDRLFKKTATDFVYLPLSQRMLFSLLFEKSLPSDLIYDKTLNLNAHKLGLLEAILCRH